MRSLLIVSLLMVFLTGCANSVETSQPIATLVPATTTPIPTATISSTPLPPEITELLENGGHYDSADNGYVDNDGILRFEFKDGILVEAIDPDEWITENGITYQIKDVTPYKNQEFTLVNTAKLKEACDVTLWAVARAQAEGTGQPVPTHLLSFGAFNEWLATNNNKVTGLSTYGRHHPNSSRYWSQNMAQANVLSDVWDMSACHIVFRAPGTSGDNRPSSMVDAAQMALYWIQVKRDNNGIPQIKVAPKFGRENEYGAFWAKESDSVEQNALHYSQLLAFWEAWSKNIQEKPDEHWKVNSGDWSMVISLPGDPYSFLDLNWNGLYAADFETLAPTFEAFVEPH